MYEPPPLPSDERIDHAAEIVLKLSEVEAIWAQVVTFERHNLECTGVWPKGDCDLEIGELDLRVPDFCPDTVDMEGSYHRQRARCRLLVRHAVERHDLDLELTREALADDDARRAA